MRLPCRLTQGRPFLGDEHGVTEGEEAIAFLYRLAVGAQLSAVVLVGVEHALDVDADVAVAVVRVRTSRIEVEVARVPLELDG